MEVDHVGVHRTHCCSIHGCKYGDDDCPVALGKIEQDFMCEDCGSDVSIELEGFEEIARLKDIERKYIALLQKYNDLLMRVEDDWR